MPISHRLTFIFQIITLVLALTLLGLYVYTRYQPHSSASVPLGEAPAIARSPAVVGGKMASYADAVDLAAPAVVNIYTTKLITERANPYANDPLYRYFYGDEQGQVQQRRENSLGSGVIVSAQGHILTNNHVIDGADEIAIALHDGRHTTAKVVGVDPESDLALLKIDLPKLPVISIGHSEQLRVGDVVLAIGNPYGVGQTVTSGIVSALGRSSLGVTTFENFIQTDAAINPGNSGGALINTQGQLIGINTVIFTESGGSHGIGFAIPTSLAQDVLTQLITQGHVVRGWLGVGIQDISEELAKSLNLKDPSGAIITHIMPGSPADKAKLERGDIITQINGRAVHDYHETLEQISRQKPGSEISLTVLRDNKALLKKAVTAERPVQDTLKPRR
ncbi:MAG: Do family serine endopeptidase [Gammaproteobacteria bacterium]|nr:Do family serine endopeptidase [Gammaproteobacteria bacterium]